MSVQYALKRVSSRFADGRFKTGRHRIVRVVGCGHGAGKLITTVRTLIEGALQGQGKIVYPCCKLPGRSVWGKRNVANGNRRRSNWRCGENIIEHST